MNKNLSSNQILMIVMATALLLLAAYAFYLLQDPYAPLPFSPPNPSSTLTPLPPTPSDTSRPSSTSLPTRQTSYTPFAATATSGLITSPQATSPEETFPVETVTPLQSGTPSPRPAATTSTIQPQNTSTQSSTATPATATVSPTTSPTLTSGQVLITGRIIVNGTPVPNVIVEFVDDVAPRTNTTDAGGHYSFISLAPGTYFSLTFRQSANPQVDPASEITSLAWVEGTLPVSNNILTLPDFELSRNLNQMIFELQAPVDGATYSASVISASNPIQFNWSLYSLGGIYHVELGPNGSDEATYISNELAATNILWSGTLSDGTHISQGAYWWRVAVTKNLGNYVEELFTQQWDITFNP